MSLLEWTVEDALSLAREEGHEDGFDEGREEGFNEGIEKGQKIVLDMLAQGLSINEIKQHLKEQV